MTHLRSIYIVFYYTLIEHLISKVLLGNIFVGGGVLIISYIAAEFSFSSASRIALDFGLGMLSLTTLGISIFMGSRLITGEIECRNLYMILSRPVRRWAFLLGKYLGLLGILAINTALLSFWCLSIFLFLGGQLSYLILWSILFIFIEGALILTIVVFFSLIVGNILAIMSSISILLVGHYIEFAKEASLTKHAQWFYKIIDFYSRYLPNFTKFNIKRFVLYEGHLENSFLYSSLLYGILYCAFFIFLSCLIFNKKELV